MTNEPREQDGAPGTEAPYHPGPRPRTIEERRRLVAESLQVGNPGNRARELPEQADPRHDCQIELKVEDIRPYEHNPRRANNARFAEIKESIRASGIRNPLTVTRRPGETHFIVEAGGNTRLLAIQQLRAETHDPRFERLTVVFRPWRSESQVLTSHLVENELRGEMTFWDKATGVLALKAQLEFEEGRTYSMPLLETAMKGLGLSVNAATLSHYQFAIQRLRTLGEAIADLSGLDVKILQPRLNLLRRHAKTQAALGEDDLYEKVFEPVFRGAGAQYRESNAFSADRLYRDCEDALAQHLGESIAELRSAMALTLRTSPAPVNPSSATVAAPTTEPGTVAPTMHRAKSPAPSVAATLDAAHSNDISEALVPPLNSPRSKSENAAPAASLIEPVWQIAALVGIEAFVRADPVAPHGYQVDLATLLTEPNSGSPIRQQVSWLLAVLADPFANPATDQWRAGTSGIERAQEDHARQDCAALLPPVPLTPAFIWQLLDRADVTGAALWELLSRVRESRPPLPSLPGVSTAQPGSR